MSTSVLSSSELNEQSPHGNPSSYFLEALNSFRVNIKKKLNFLKNFLGGNYVSKEIENGSLIQIPSTKESIPSPNKEELDAFLQFIDETLDSAIILPDYGFSKTLNKKFCKKLAQIARESVLTGASSVENIEELLTFSQSKCSFIYFVPNVKLSEIDSLIPFWILDEFLVMRNKTKPFDEKTINKGSLHTFGFVGAEKPQTFGLLSKQYCSVLFDLQKASSETGGSSESLKPSDLNSRFNITIVLLSEIVENYSLLHTTGVTRYSSMVIDPTPHPKRLRGKNTKETGFPEEEFRTKRESTKPQETISFHLVNKFVKFCDVDKDGLLSLRDLKHWIKLKKLSLKYLDQDLESLFCLTCKDLSLCSLKKSKGCSSTHPVNGPQSTLLLNSISPSKTLRSSSTFGSMRQFLSTGGLKGGRHLQDDVKTLTTFTSGKFLGSRVQTAGELQKQVSFQNGFKGLLGAESLIGNADKILLSERDIFSVLIQKSVNSGTKKKETTSILEKKLSAKWKSIIRDVMEFSQKFEESSLVPGSTKYATQTWTRFKKHMDNKEEATQRKTLPPVSKPFKTNFFPEAGVLINNTFAIHEKDNKPQEKQYVDPLNQVVNSKFVSHNQANNYPSVTFNTQQYYWESERISLEPYLVSKNDIHPIFRFVPEQLETKNANDGVSLDMRSMGPTRMALGVPGFGMKSMNSKITGIGGNQNVSGMYSNNSMEWINDFKNSNVNTVTDKILSSLGH